MVESLAYSLCSGIPHASATREDMRTRRARVVRGTGALLCNTATRQPTRVKLSGTWHRRTLVQHRNTLTHSG